MQEGLMRFRNCVRAPVVGALLALLAVSPVAAQPFASEGTYEIPAGAKFNPEKLAKITAFFKNEVDTGKISGADILIRQRGKDVYHEIFGVQDTISKAPITDKTIFRLSSLT
jgi:CubicO group peptidase (beta-lactamase class C family)